MTSQVEQRVGGEQDVVQQPTLLLVCGAGICWAVALALLLLVDLARQNEVLAPQRVLFYVALLLGGLLTFVPLQIRMQLPGLALRGVGGTALLLYMLAFVPPPTQWLFWLPDLPVYLLFGCAVFWSASALAEPLIFAAGQRLFQARLRQHDLRRVGRQAAGVGLLAACSVLLAGMRVLTLVSFLLLTLILITIEVLFLARVKAE
jgi:hypothetical protein